MLRTSLASLLFPILLLTTAALHSQSSENNSPPNVPGQMVDVGGYRMHLYCTGQGSPTVILENGLGDIFVDWSLVQPEVAKYTRICSHDHAYEGFSDAGPVPVTMGQQVFETRLMLQNAKILPPYLFVGHSYGGMLARLYTIRYPSEVVGLVLVDAMHEGTVIANKGLVSMSNGKPAPPPQTMKSSPPPLPTAEEQARFEKRKKALEAEAAAPVTSPLDRLPPDALRLRAWAHAHPKFLAGPESDPTRWILVEVRQISEARRGQVYPFGNMPLVVIGESRDNPSSQEDRRGQLEDMASLSSNGKVIIDQNSGHHVQWDDPAFVVQAIRQAYDAAKFIAKP